MKRRVLPIFMLLVAVLFLSFASRPGELGLYGGRQQNVYLGCVSCGCYDAQSIWNSVGIYGSKTGAHSIWNEFGSYGSEYSGESAFNENATDPPVVKDAAGNVYGYLTLDRFKQGRMENDLFLLVYEHYKEIREDVTAWYTSSERKLNLDN